MSDISKEFASLNISPEQKFPNKSCQSCHNCMSPRRSSMNSDSRFSTILEKNGWTHSCKCKIRKIKNGDCWTTYNHKRKTNYDPLSERSIAKWSQALKESVNSEDIGTRVSLLSHKLEKINCDEDASTSQSAHGVQIDKRSKKRLHRSKSLPENQIEDKVNNCSAQALMPSPADDVTVNELAGYFDVMVYIPKEMSAMAEMMYT